MKIKINSTRFLIIVFLVAAIILIACKKENSATSAADEKNFPQLSSSSNIESSQAFDDVYNNVMGVNSEVAFGGTGIFGRTITVDSLSNPCFTVKTTRLNPPYLFPAKIDIDFGAGCLGKDGITRKGIISAVYSGCLTLSTSKAQISFDNFYLDDAKIEGSEVIENISTPIQMIFKVTVQDGKLTRSNSNYSIWNSINTVTQIDGSATPAIAKDDVLSITGTSNGSLINDSVFLKWSAKIEQPLIKKFSCRWIVQGKTGITGTATDEAFIDFGNGDCDNKASLIIKTSTTEITLH